ncbi:MAG TPA: hypothetical protein VFQ53_38480 [Kofleriaceae bacterium]|nr:hypothetical protein [Kofleriaceae bacterium]
MRSALACVVVAACTTPYDPVAEIPHAEFATTSDAVAAILADAPGTRVYAIGEYHPTAELTPRSSPLARFTTEIVGQLEPRAQHLVVEAWFDPSCVRGADPVQTQIQAATSRPPSQQSDLAGLVMRAGQGMQLHGLPMTCIEHGSVLDAKGRVDFWRLLALVTEKLHDTTEALVAQGRDVIVYGGALHNDLYPRWPLEELSYARSLATEVPVLELDLVVPEVVAPMASIRQERWFPLLARASPDRVVVWERGPGSYVLILPAQSDAVARVAQADDLP